MALKPKNTGPALSREQVLQIREMYYGDNRSYRSLAKEYNVTMRVIEKAVKGIGKFYGSIQDDIPDHIKENRVPSREKYGLTKLRKQQQAYNQTGTTFMMGWTEQQINCFYEKEKQRYENAKKWGF